MEEFYILSLKWSDGDNVTWWKPKDCGYTTVLDRAGRYSAEEVAANRRLYDNGDSTRAIPCEVAEREAVRVVPNERAIRKRMLDAVKPFDPIELGI